MAQRWGGAGTSFASATIVANNRLEWAVLAYATYGPEAIFVPLYEG
jgi:hypothetical protein